MLKYIKVTLCDGCQQCVRDMGNGQQVRQEHVIKQEDITDTVARSLLRLERPDNVILDVTIKEPQDGL